ncbi:thermonuclease family protein [Mycoplasmopsis cynos]|uniref:thermonuclease family protein n=2 Tax=Mycoplasmopsis cynos TaxID=171284 RepID=UPI002AFED4CA|nr:thermonuclease family protein [Mycoplasmopsis cynos]WQQ17992.1 thermonuclease family protein [Mycoplasmopsis cynos]
MINHKKVLLSIGTLASVSLATSSLLVACSKKEGLTAVPDVKIKDQTLEQSGFYTLTSNSKYLQNDKQSKEFLSFNIDNTEFIYENKKFKFYRLGYRSTKNKGDWKKTEDKIKSLIKNYLLTKYYSKYIYPTKKTNSNKILFKLEDFQNLPDEIKIGINGKLATLRLQRTPFFSKIILGEYGENNSKTLEQNAANTLDNVDTTYNFTYDIYLGNAKLEGFIEPTVSKEYNSIKIKPLLKDAPINTDVSNFKALNFDFENDQNLRDLYFKAKVKDVSDGDTVTVISLEDKQLANNVSVKKDEEYRIRLSGIDTPEKALGSKKDFKKSSAFEYAFALHATKFAEEILGKKFANDVVVGFASGKDSYERITADIFFGEKYKYSYNAEIVRAGHTLPFKNQGWEANVKNKNIKSYEYNMYKELAIALSDAINNKKGLFNYFNNPIEVQRFVYLIKPNSEWLPFYKEKINTEEKTIYDYFNDIK